MAQQSKQITIQLWTDLNYCRVIGIWYPEAPEPIELDTPDQSQPYFNDSPFIIVLSSIFKPRTEVMGNNPVAPGQHPMPKDFMEQQVRHMSYLFANEFGIFQPETKAITKSFLAKQTFSYKMVKEFNMNVTPATGAMSLKDLKNSIEQYSIEDQEKIQVLTVGENPIDADAKGIENFIHTDTNDGTRQYISVTKLANVYPIDNPYIVKSILPEDPSIASLPPGTQDAELSQAFVNEAEAAKQIDTTNREALEVFDNLSAEPQPVLDENGEPTMDENGEPVTAIVQPSREEILEELLKQKNAKIAELEPDEPKEIMPQPMTEADQFPEEAQDQADRENLNETFTPREM